MGYLAQLSIPRSVPQDKAEIEEVPWKSDIATYTFNLLILVVI